MIIHLSLTQLNTPNQKVAALKERKQWPKTKYQSHNTTLYFIFDQIVCYYKTKRTELTLPS
jgi:hypothetical protein